MKALTLTQPWAYLTAVREKVIETGSWGTSYRGPLAIHAAKGFPRDARAICLMEPFRSVLAKYGVMYPDDLTLGAIVGTCELVGCIRFGPLFMPSGAAAAHELDFGDFSAGRYGFLLKDAIYRAPQPCRGALGLWDVPQEIANRWGLCDAA